MKKKIQKLKVACIQIDSGLSWEPTWRRIKEKHFVHALDQKAEIIVLPEMFLMRGSAEDLKAFPQNIFKAVIDETKSFCKKNKVSILLGSLPEKDLKNSSKIYNSSILISEKGKIAAKYQKMHLFDIEMSKKCTVKESRDISAGGFIRTGYAQGIKAGLSICYDLRFPELYRSLSQQGCEIVFIPANFTYLTGQSHWEILLRARAIENQMFIIAPNQSGYNQHTGLRSYGKSMIISPWGDILGKSKITGEEVIVAELDFKYLRQIRTEFPVLKHRKIA